MSSMSSALTVEQTPTTVNGYEVEFISSRLWTGTLNHRKLQDMLNTRQSSGYRLADILTSHRRLLLLFKWETHFLIFVR